MARVVSEIDIEGPIEQVFDVVTTARHWTEWHPATISVGGVTERPVALGDLVHERAKIGAGEYEGDWKVTEHVRPTRVVLRVEGADVRITYAFASKGQETTFRRELEFEPADFAGSAADPAVVKMMDQQSAEGLRKLKQVVEENLKTRHE